jgi:hypothetical protein
MIFPVIVPEFPEISCFPMLQSYWSGIKRQIEPSADERSTTRMSKLMRIFAGAMTALMLVTPALAEEAVRPGITARKAQGIVIDGKLDDWNLDSPAVVADVSQIIRDGVVWKGAEDCSANFYLAWDEENLYMAAEVTEDTPLGAIEMLPIDGQDNLKLYISTDPGADPERAEYATNDFLVYFVMIEGYWDTAIDRSMVPKDARQRFVSKGMDGGESVLDGFACAIEMTIAGFNWEAVIPWTCFTNDRIGVYVPAAGDTLSCNFAITDIDYPCPGT